MSWAAVRLYIVYWLIMLSKVRSRSLMGGDAAQPDLRTHVDALIEQSEELIRERMQKQQQREARVQAVERTFTEWADKKERAMRQKIAKSVKNKQEHISGIVKKCRDHEKFLGEKLKEYQNRKKNSLREAWEKASRFQKDLEGHAPHRLPSRENIPHRAENAHFLTESHYIGGGLQEPALLQNNKEYLSTYYPNKSKPMGNTSKEYWGELNQAVEPSHRRLKAPRLNEAREEGTGETHVVWKLKETLDRFRHHTDQQERRKVQQLGEHLEKIQKYRTNRIQLRKKRQDRTATTYDEDEQRGSPTTKRLKPATSKLNRSERVHSQSVMRQRRVRDWSEANRLKREEEKVLFLQQGTDYLESQKIKHMKNSLAKKIALEAIEKKLYYERLHH